MVPTTTSTTHHSAPSAPQGGPVDYALHRATGPVWIVHQAFAAPARAIDAIRAWGERNLVRIGVVGAAVVAVQTAGVAFLAVAS